MKNEYEKHEGIIIKLLTGFEDKEFPVDLRIKTDQGKIEHEHYTVVLQSQRYQGQKRILEIRKF